MNSIPWLSFALHLGLLHFLLSLRLVHFDGRLFVDAKISFAKDI